MSERQFLVQEDLNQAIGKRVLLRLRAKNIQFAGTLERFDQRLNLYLRDAVETIGGRQINRQQVIIRGDSISMVCY